MRRHWIRLGACFALSALLGMPSCRNDMRDGARLKPLEKTNWPPSDNRSAFDLPDGAVERGTLATTPEGEYLLTGQIGGQPGNTLPFPLTRDVLTRGQERFNIYCTPCHDHLGTGQGMVVQRGFKRPPSYHIDRLRQAPLGHFVDVMTRGFGAMYSYAYRVPPHDRWAIATYIRVLQLSQNAPLDTVPPEEAQKLRQMEEP
jgi:hypothetical protein